MTAEQRFDHRQPHQSDAVDAVVSVFRPGTFVPDPVGRANPQLKMNLADFKLQLHHIQQRFGISKNKRSLVPKRVIDVEMETGTGKTYTLTKTMFALHQAYGLSKFVVLVPTLAIKSGFMSFITSDAAKQHFGDEFGQTLTVHLVQAQRSKPENAAELPAPVREFVEASATGEDGIHVLLLNAGMLNSPTFAEQFVCSGISGEIATPIDAIASARSVVIIDEPHRFPVGKKTWQNIERLKPQLTLRYGATFNEQYSNLVYELDEEKAFKLGLVKGVEEYRFETMKQGFAKLKLISLCYSDSHRGLAVSRFDFGGYQRMLHSVRFHLYEWGMRKAIELTETDLAIAHPTLQGLSIVGATEKGIELSNGLFLPIGHSINPFDVSALETLEDQMLQEVIAKHFDIERQFLTQRPRIKPFTLVFISNIDDYRDEKSERSDEQSLREKFERMLFEELLKRVETEQDPYYKNYLQRSLSDVSRLHGGYFARDHSSKDPSVLQQRDAILDPKSKLLPLENLCRFVFCKWALREGWDNPNVFQICKIRASGSLTAERQELGRGLRLPLDENHHRVKDNDFKLRYFIDETECFRRRDKSDVAWFLSSVEINHTIA